MTGEPTIAEAQAEVAGARQRYRSRRAQPLSQDEEDRLLVESLAAVAEGLKHGFEARDEADGAHYNLVDNGVGGKTGETTCT